MGERHQSDFGAAFGAGLEADARAAIVARAPHFHFDVECLDARGNVRWRERMRNLVVNEGLDSLLDVYFVQGTQINTWHVGIIETLSFTAIVAADTAAGIQASGVASNDWYEFDDYDGASRPVCSLAAVSGQSTDNSAAKASYAINASRQVTGAFVAEVTSKGGTTGKLYGGAQFTGGDRSVQSGDTLNVTTTLTSSAS